MPRYKSAVRFFLVGMVLVGIGVTTALAVDFVSMTEITGLEAPE
jgi:hypothetical protein